MPTRRAKTYQPPATISRPELLHEGSDRAFRDHVFLMVHALDGLMSCRDAFGRSMGLTGSQFAVLIGTAYQQGATGVSIRDLADHVRLAQPHVTTEVGRLIRKGLLTKRLNTMDRRGVLVSLSRAGELAVDQVTPLVKKVNDRLFSSLSLSELNTIGRVMRTLVLQTEVALSDVRLSKSMNGSAAIKSGRIRKRGRSAGAIKTEDRNP